MAKKLSAKEERYLELRTMLKERRKEILSEVQDKNRERREGSFHARHVVVDIEEVSESDIQDDIEFALLEMKSDTLSKIEGALSRLDQGTYGYCFECGGEIAERRLRALPFAIRCRDCEEVREIAQLAEARAARRRTVNFLLV